MLLLAAALPAAAQTHPLAEADGAVRIMMADFKKLIASGGVVIVDTRGADAFRQGHIPGAIQVSVSDLAAGTPILTKTVDLLKAAKKPVVTYCPCLHDEAAAQAAVILSQRGVPDVRALFGGWTAWVESGNPVARGDE